MAAANFVVITNGGGARLLEQPISTNGMPRAFFPRVAIGCRLLLKIDRNLGGVLIRGYMRWYSVNRRYGIWYFIQICGAGCCQLSAAVIADWRQITGRSRLASCREHHRAVRARRVWYVSSFNAHASANTSVNTYNTQLTYTQRTSTSRHSAHRTLIRDYKQRQN